MRRFGFAQAVIHRLVVVGLLLSVLPPLGPATAHAQGASDIQYVHDPLGRLVAVIDPATETALYQYDAVGNVTAITRQSSSAISVLEFAPRTGAVGSAVTVYGTGFSLTPNQNPVTIGGTAATVTSATATQLVVTVPNTAGGSIAVTSPAGSATSSASFGVVATAAPTVSGVSPTIIGGNGTFTVTGTGFDPVAASNTVALGGPTRGRVTSGTASSLTVAAPPYAGSGPVTVATDNGIVVSSADLFVAPPPYLAADVGHTGRMAAGPSQTVTLSTANKIGLVVFDLPVASSVWIDITNVTISSSQVSILNPDTTQVATATVDTGGAAMQVLGAAFGGTFTVLVDPVGTATGSMTLTMSTPVGGTIVPGGAPVTISMATGQNAALGFNGTQGQRVSVLFTQFTTQPAITILNPDATVLFGPVTFFIQPPPRPKLNFIDPLTLPSNGQYTILIDPPPAQSGNITVTLYNVPADVGGTITPGGAPLTVALTVPGQNARPTFAAAANQRVSLSLSSVTAIVSYISILGPGGAPVAPAADRVPIASATGFVDVVGPLAAGTYTILVDPAVETTGAATLTLHDVPPDLTDTIVAGGPSRTVNIAAPGQNARLTFSGTLNQRVSVKLDGAIASAAMLTLLKPDGTTLSGPTSLFVDLQTLPVAGTYTILVDPTGAATGSGTVTLYDVPADPTPAMTIGGGAVTVTITTPGQNARPTFSGTASQAVVLTMTNVTIASSRVSILRPGGQPASGARNVTITTSGGTIALTLPETATYTIVVDPDGANTGNMTLALTPGGGLTEWAPDLTVVAGDPRDDAPDSGELMAASLALQEDQWTPAGRNLRGDWRSHFEETLVTAIPPLAAPAGVTAIAGQVVTYKGEPLPGVAVAVAADSGEERTGTSDATGRFLITGVPSGRVELLVAGTTANRPGRTWGLFEIGVDAAAGATTALDFPIWMPRIDTAHAKSIPALTTQEVVITTPHIPGLELRIPAGVRITDHEGRPVTEVGITAIPVDRPPFPLPENSTVPVYFTIQPGAAYVSGPGARLIYPNYTDETPGTRIDFWRYEPEEGWSVYGKGTVTANGKQVVPDPGVRIYEFTGAMIAQPSLAAAIGKALGDLFAWAGEPVDAGTGLFVETKTDLILPDVLPLGLTRSYRQDDTRSRAFGIGASHEFDLFLVGSRNPWTYQDLILPDGGRVHYTRTSSGGSFANAEYVHSGTPSGYDQSTIVWNGNGWTLTLRDGTAYTFPVADGVTLAPLAAPVRVRDRFGNTMSLIREGGSGNLLFARSPNGRWISFSYDGSSRVTQARDNLGRTVGYAYDGSGRLATVTDVANGVWTYTYDSTTHRMLTLKDPKNIVYLTNEYDPVSGRITRQTQADGTTYQFAYTLANGLISQVDVTDPRGTVRRVTFAPTGYDDGGTYKNVYSTSVTQALGQPIAQTTTITRDGNNRITALAEAPFGRTTNLSYDSKGNVASITEAAGSPVAATTSFTYNVGAFSELLTVTDPRSQTTTLDYDARGALLSVTDPLNHTTTLVNNGAGQPTQVTDALNQTTQLGYTLGDLTAVTDPLGRRSSRWVDGGGRVLRTRDPDRNRSEVSYSNLNLPTSVTDALGGVTALAYDGNGNLTSLTDALSHATQYQYNGMDRVTSRTDPLLRAASFGYDQNGNLTGATDRKGQPTTISYDVLDRPTAASFAGGSTITATYDAGNRVTQVSDSPDGALSFGYDLRDRVTSETTPRGSVSYGYDAASRRTGMTVAGQAAVSYAYDNADRLTGIARGSAAVGFTYDNGDRLTDLTLPDGITQSYSHDGANQLTGLSSSLGANTLGTLSYGYDGAGRRSRVGGSFARTSLPAALTSASYNAANQLTSWGGTALTYDNNGNLTGDGTNGYTWNSRDQLTAITGPTAASFSYDGVGRRASKTVAGTTTSFGYDGLNVVQELVGGVPSANLLTGLGIDQVYSRTEGAATSTYLSDALGSTIALADSAGAVQTSYTYEPFGKPSVTGAASTNPYQFTGRENDGTGLQYSRARYYHPTFGRFISEDPLGFGAGDANLYAYVGNSPANFTDPMGTNPLAAACVGGGAFNAGVDLVSNSLAGRKNTLGGALTSFGTGCVTSLLAPLAIARLVKIGIAGGEVVGIGRAAANVVNAACSFSADTVVAAESGSKPIGEIQVGERVLAYDEASGSTGSYPVTAVLAHEDSVVQWLTVGGEFIQTTPEHPFYVEGRGWVPAGELEVGARIRRADGSTDRVEANRVEPRQQAMLNLTVEDAHTFFVGAGQWLVHNQCDLLPGQIPQIVFQSQHAARHLAGTGLSAEAVEAAIRQSITQAISRASSVGPFWGQVTVGGTTITYRAFALPNGVINVGTYVLPKL